MSVYVALLRGINVSGQKIIRMEDLRSTFERLRFTDVQTYVQSGNVKFNSAKGSEGELAEQIQRAILKDFGFDVPVLIKSSKDLQRVLKGSPFAGKKNVDDSRLYVTFLKDTPVASAAKNLAKLSSAADQFKLQGSEIYLFCPTGYGKTKLSNNAFEKILGVPATTRNWKTLKALVELSES